MCSGADVTCKGYRLNGHGYVFAGPDSAVIFVPQAVISEANLTFSQSDDLFQGQNSLDDIADILTEITGEDRRGEKKGNLIR